VYSGWLENNGQLGQLFDSNTADKPLNFKVGENRVVRGFEEGVKGMRKGGKRVLVIPSEMGYGKNGAGSQIPPNATLIFFVRFFSFLFRFFLFVSLTIIFFSISVGAGGIDCFEKADIEKSIIDEEQSASSSSAGSGST
jgi:hypothetical protein